jgi:hypothetical protein
MFGIDKDRMQRGEEAKQNQQVDALQVSLSPRIRTSYPAEHELMLSLECAGERLG